MRLRAAYNVAYAGCSLRPRLDLDAYLVSLSGCQEYGAGAVIIVRPYLAGGVVVRPDNTLTLDPSFEGPSAASARPSGAHPCSDR